VGKEKLNFFIKKYSIESNSYKRGKKLNFCFGRGGEGGGRWGGDFFLEVY
jgi:hypothetical protein